ncbi:hypothetical protein BN1723_017426, partial [Verticillium longisporum]
YTDKVASAHPDGIKFFVDWHAFGHIILMPYGGNCSLRVANYDRQMELARQTTAIIESVAGSKYSQLPVKMSAQNKIAPNSPSRASPSELEQNIAQALYDLETNTADLKVALRPLQFVSAREVRTT